MAETTTVTTVKRRRKPTRQKALSDRGAQPWSSLTRAHGSPNGHLSEKDAELLRALRQEVAEGGAWGPALLNAVARWTAANEVLDTEYYQYLIGSEAFDWLRLAERLCREIEGCVPVKELHLLLTEGVLPHGLTDQDFRRYLGAEKYRAHLNYWYGVVVEEALWAVTDEEIMKERLSRCAPFRADLTDDVFRRLYGKSRMDLLRQFRSEKGLPDLPLMSYVEGQEFTYWLFKLRFGSSEKARVASDTRKGLEYLHHLKSRLVSL
ncbi:MAG: hypothetical protein HYU29_00285 [Chloroflexi bacterium]|nr:hypothetical protein [Chloroflexota bacterium]